MAALTPLALTLALLSPASAWDIKTVNIHRDAAQARRLVYDGERKLEVRNFPGALASFELATQADPDSVSAYFHLADAHYQKAFSSPSGKADPLETQAAIADYQTALALDPKLRTTADPFPYFHGMAQCYTVMGRYTEALDALKRAAEFDSANPMPDLYAAQIHALVRDPSASSADFLRSAKRALRARQMPRLAKLAQFDPLFDALLTVPQNKTILRSYLGVQSGKLTVARADQLIRKAAPAPPIALLAMRDVAEGDLRDSLASRPNRPSVIPEYTPNAPRQAVEPEPSPDAVELPGPPPSSAWVRIGISYRRMGLAKEAIRALERAVADKPSDPDAHYQLSLAYAMDGQPESALTSLNWALSSARTSDELRRTVGMAQAAPALAPLRGMPRYKQILRSHRLELAGLP